MPLIADPSESFFSISQGLIGRIFLFFGSGWFGTVIGRIASAFKKVEDLLHPIDAATSGWTSVPTELLFLVTWWGHIINASAMFPPFLFVVFPLIAFIAYKAVYCGKITPFWCFLLITTSAVMYVFGFSEGWLPWLILAIILTGLVYAMWWAVQKYHSEWVDRAKEMVHRK